MCKIRQGFTPDALPVTNCLNWAWDWDFMVVPWGVVLPKGPTAVTWCEAQTPDILIIIPSLKRLSHYCNILRIQYVKTLKTSTPQMPSGLFSCPSEVCVKAKEDFLCQKGFKNIILIEYILRVS